MPVFVRIRNGLAKLAGVGGATEGDIRGNSSDFVEQSGGVVDLLGGHLLVHQDSPATLGVTVDPGVGYIPNANFDEFDSDSIKFWEAVLSVATDVAVASNSSGSTRIDLICLYLNVATIPNNFASNIASLVVVQGTPGAGAPSLPDDHLLLAEVTVVDGATTITNGSISDERVQITIKESVRPPEVPHVESTVALSDGATPALDASLGNIFTLSAVGNRTIAVPSNPTEGQKIIIIHHASGGARTLSLNTGTGGFVFGDDITALTATNSGERDLIGAIYNATINKWMVVAYVKGYGIS